MARLRRSDLTQPGFTRRRRGRRFAYYDYDGALIGDEEVVERIDKLAIPPAWQEVWISGYPNGHIQAVGTDSAGRRQYRYHDDWRAARDAQKFERAVELAGQLPRLRKRVERDLTEGAGLTSDRVTAAAVRLLDLGTFRIGNPEYAEEHDTFGLTTLQRRHVRVQKDVVSFHYVAKYSIERVEAIEDENIADIVRALRRRRAPAEHPLFCWREGPQWHTLHSGHVNDYLREATGLTVSAKDFRTWHATVLMALALAGASPAETRTARRRAVAQAYRDVSEQLGNTPSVVKKSYADPRLVEQYERGVTLSDQCRMPGPKAMLTPRRIRVVERAVVALIAED